MIEYEVKKEIKFLRYEWNRYKTILFIIVTVLTLEAYFTGSLENFLENLGNYSYAGAFIAGFFFTYGATTPFALATFYILAEDLNIWLLTIIGSFGGIFSEYIIYDFAKAEIRKKFIIYKNRKIKIPQIKSKLLKKLSPLIAGIIIASPIPDEFASILFGIEKYKLRDFLIFTFVCKFIGILIIVGLGRIF